MFVNALLNGIIQVLLFSLIPFIWWLITARKREKFNVWMGLKKPVFADKKAGLLSIAGIFIVLWAVGELAIYLRGPMAAADSQYTGMGAGVVPAVLA